MTPTQVQLRDLANFEFARTNGFRFDVNFEPLGPSRAPQLGLMVHSVDWTHKADSLDSRLTVTYIEAENAAVLSALKDINDVSGQATYALYTRTGEQAFTAHFEGLKLDRFNVFNGYDVDPTTANVLSITAWFTYTQYT